MQQSAASANPSTSPSFAGLLAALATPTQKTSATWNDDDLADDVATLSYERALKAHSRYKAPEPVDFETTHAEGIARAKSLVQAELAARAAAVAFDSSTVPSSIPEPFFYPESFETFDQAAVQPAPRPAAKIDSQFSHQPAASMPVLPLEENLKRASITIRMSKDECAQLHQRAAEAGMTVSAYLRSCTFEAETLRTMVKETLAQLRTATAAAKATEAAPPLIKPEPSRTVQRKSRPHFRHSWLRRFFIPWQASQNVARA
jgi:hypothetical protein